MSVRGHHDLAGHGVAEVDDRLDQLALRTARCRRPRPPRRRGRAAPPRSRTGPASGPCPGRITLVRPMSSRATSRNGAPDERARSAPSSSAARSVCCSAHVFGAASATTNTTTTLTTVAMATPHPPNTRTATTPVSDGLHGLRHEHHQEQRVEVALEVVDDLAHPLGTGHAPGRPAPAPWPVTIRVIAVSARARTPRHEDQHDDQRRSATRRAW